MKVSLEGNRTEFEELVTTLAYGIIHQAQRAHFQRVNLNTEDRDSKSPDRPNHGEVRTGDDVPNRFREEGVQ